MSKKEIVVRFSEESVSVSVCRVSGVDLIVGAYFILKALVQAAGFAEGTKEFDEALQDSIEVMQMAAGLDGVESAVAKLLESVGFTHEVK